MAKVNISKLRMFVGLFVLTACIGCDQATKFVATTTLQNAPPKSFLGETVYLGYAMNPGGFLSLGSNLPDSVRQYMFIAVNSAMMISLSIYLIRNTNLSLVAFVSLALILAGGIGNLIDRVCNDGLVTDFIVLRLGPIHTGVFNVADVAVTVGVTLLFCGSFQKHKGEHLHTDDESRTSAS